MDAGGPFNLSDLRWTADIRAVDKICYYGDNQVMISHPPDGTMWIAILRNNRRKITHRETVLAKGQTSASLVGGKKVNFFHYLKLWTPVKICGEKIVFLSLPSPSVNYGIAKFCYFYIFTHFYSNNGVSSAASLRTETYRSPGECNLSFYLSVPAGCCHVPVLSLWCQSRRVPQVRSASALRGGSRRINIIRGNHLIRPTHCLIPRLIQSRLHIRLTYSLSLPGTGLNFTIQ